MRGAGREKMVEARQGGEDREEEDTEPGHAISGSFFFFLVAGERLLPFSFDQMFFLMGEGLVAHYASRKWMVIPWHGAINGWQERTEDMAS